MRENQSDIRDTVMLPVDTTWLRMDSEANRMIINGLLFFESTFTMAEIRDVLNSRLIQPHLRFRQRPVKCGARYNWRETPRLDLDYHIDDLTQMSLPDESVLQETVSLMVNRPLDADKPLWRCHVFSNGESGSVVLLRLHHCYADGVALLALLDAIADQSVLASSPAFNRQFKRFAPLSGKAALSFALAWMRELAKIVCYRADRSSLFSMQLSGEKTVGWVPALELNRVRRVSKVLNCTVNDVVLSCLSGSVRRYLMQSGEDLKGIRFRAVVPVNLRPLSEGLALGNCFGLVYLTLPVGLSDMTQRLKAVQRNMTLLKKGVQAMMTFHMLSLLGRLPRFIEHWALNFFSKKASAVMTNVPGPAEPVVLNGNPLIRPMFWVPQSGDLGLGISIVSYREKLEIGFLADKALMSDTSRLVEGFLVEFDLMEQQVRTLIH